LFGGWWWGFGFLGKFIGGSEDGEGGVKGCWGGGGGWSGRRWWGVGVEGSLVNGVGVLF